VKGWDLRSLAPSSEKAIANEPGAGAPRVPRVGRQMPRVLFSSSECRAVVIDLEGGEQLGDHEVRERAVLQVIAGRVSIACSGRTVECETGTLLTFDPGERHAGRALVDARLLLVLAPWPGARRTTESEDECGQRLPTNAVSEPIPSFDPTLGIEHCEENKLRGCLANVIPDFA
jgi:quercetin dioxygenase-like cupin family protein